MSSNATTITAAAVAAAAGLLLTGCTSTPTAISAPAPDTGLGHVHGIVDLGGSTVLLGTHIGLYTLTDTGDISGPLGDADFDAMGLTADGDVLYASGHPGPNTPAELGEHNLGLIRSTDAGTTWEPVAFTGQEDFHVLTAGDRAIHGIGSSSITIRTSTDGGTTWIDGAELPAADLTVTTDGTLYAATRQGLQESRDAGATFDLVADAPPLYLVEADFTGGLVGVDTDGTLWRLTGTGSWDSVGAATGTVQALGNADGAVVLVDDRGVVWIHGTETTVVLPTGTAQ
ncbi:MAG: hypothetical protein DI566_13920 [Microbacterium sp.]|nr:MAG: hypothetical protein DI566_13920 [Microbacterium sp.]